MSKVIYSFNKIINQMNLWELGTQIKRDDGQVYKLMKSGDGKRKFGRLGKKKNQPRFMTYSNIEHTFEIIEEEPEIDIQSLEELRTEYTESRTDYDMRNYINRVILPAIKQLDKQINNK